MSLFDKMNDAVKFDFKLGAPLFPVSGVFYNFEGINNDFTKQNSI